MENSYEPTIREPKYTKMWIGLQILYVLVIAGVLTAISVGITSLAGSRYDDGLLSREHLNLLNTSTNYCFVLITLTLMSITLIELSFRKNINIVQYILMGCALCIFFLLLLSMAELMPFWCAYIIVALMTIGLISLFMKAINRNIKASIATAAILSVEYGLLFMMVYLGSMVLLAGSLLLFAIIATAMYITLKLKVKDDELILR